MSQPRLAVWRTMAVLRGDDLLRGPRGRGLCMAVAHRLNEDAWAALLHAEWHPEDVARREVLLETLAAVDPAPVRAWRDPLHFLEPMDGSVGNAMYWQPPDEMDVILAEPRVTEALRPVADAIADSPATDWWNTAIDLTAQRYTSLFHNEPPSPPRLLGARGELDRWREDTLRDEARATARPTDPAAPFSGYWWSTPELTRLVTTTRAVQGLGSIQLAWQEDSLGHSDAAIWPLTPIRRPRVCEIDGPGSWIRLVANYPLDVTNARRHDWYKLTGRHGTWLIPDWSAVAEEWDAVHLSVAGYLTAATRSLRVAEDAATVLAGWSPDETWWLTDVLATSSTAPETWHNATDLPELSWRRIPE